MLVRVCPPEDNASRLKAARPEDFESRLAPTPWHRAAVLDDGRRVRIGVVMGACPLARVEVKERRASVVISLFERRPPLLLPDGTPIGILAIGIVTSFDLLLPSPVGDRRLIDGATGFDPATTSSGRRGERINMSGSRVEVPIGRTFDWKQLTGRAWWGGPGLRHGQHAPHPPPAGIHFFISDRPSHPDKER
jgi:hypothetical protein